MYKYRLVERLLFPPLRLDKKRLERTIQGKCILITGASSGIGESLAYVLADFSVHMILVARSYDKLKLMKDEIEKKSAQVSIFPADLRDHVEMKDLLTFLHQLPNGIDIIVSNAGKSIRRSIYDSLDRFHDFTRTMAINYFAPVQLMLSTIPMLQKNGGHVINVSTVNACLIPVPFWAAYQASKTAFDTWFRSVSLELNAEGIATSSLYLPLVRTPMITPTKAYDTIPAMKPEHVAHLICKMMYTRKKLYKPWWLIFGQWASLLFRSTFERMAVHAIKKRGHKS